MKLPLHKLDDLTFSSFTLPQCPWLDAVGFIRELLPVAEGGYRAGLHAGADSRSGPAVFALLHPVAAGQDHRGGSQQGAGFTSLTGLLQYTLTNPNRSLSVFLQRADPIHRLYPQSISFNTLNQHRGVRSKSCYSVVEGSWNLQDSLMSNRLLANLLQRSVTSWRMLFLAQVQ